MQLIAGCLAFATNHRRTRQVEGLICIARSYSTERSKAPVHNLVVTCLPFSIWAVSAAMACIDSLDLRIIITTLATLPGTVDILIYLTFKSEAPDSAALAWQLAAVVISSAGSPPQLYKLGNQGIYWDNGKLGLCRVL